MVVNHSRKTRKWFCVEPLCSIFVWYIACVWYTHSCLSNGMVLLVATVCRRFRKVTDVLGGWVVPVVRLLGDAGGRGGAV